MGIRLWNNSRPGAQKILKSRTSKNITRASRDQTRCGFFAAVDRRRMCHTQYPPRLSIRLARRVEAPQPNISVTLSYQRALGKGRLGREESNISPNWKGLGPFGSQDHGSNARARVHTSHRNTPCISRNNSSDGNRLKSQAAPGALWTHPAVAVCGCCWNRSSPSFPRERCAQLRKVRLRPLEQTCPYQHQPILQGRRTTERPRPQPRKRTLCWWPST